ncbi:caspase family protein [Mesorhizobium sp. ASY16-5R]|uniref:caspase family protein n=1 Tax=Mesorhizobium sp. ASY16-5R TaxID=3445772 RepID=UPI003F9FFA30
MAESLRLVGPKNDSREMANTLARLGVAPADITVLADGVDGLAEGIANPGPGTREAVLAGLDRLAETAKAGDLVVFYFSGHGSQQPDQDSDEQGGNDEIFLPYDVGNWTGKGVENALVDDELNARVRKILDKGADFFGVIDACNSATGFRALAGDDVRARGVEPAELGVPAAASSGRGLIAARMEQKPGRGRAAFFYAAQEIEEALEKTPKDAAPGESFGVFTYTLLGRLNATPGLTYRTLHQAVMADIKRNTLMATQTPELEGELLDEPVLGLSAATARKQWPVFSGKLQAGALEGISAGSVLALYEDATTPDDRPVAHGVVETAGASRSVVAPVMWPCESDAAACAAGVDAAAFKKGRFARLVERGVDLGLVLSEPVRVDPDDGHDYTAAVAALRQATAMPALAPRVSLRREGYDIAVGLVDGTIAFSPAGGLIDRDGRSPRLTLPDEPQAAAQAVADAIGRMARATALQRLDPRGEAAEKLGLTPRILARASAVRPGKGAPCPDGESNYAAAKPTSENPVLADCDILSIEMENIGRKPLDVTVLLIGADFSITPVWPTNGNSNRIHIGEKRTVDILQMEPNPKASAEERLVFLAVPGVNRAHTAFTDLGQDGLRAMPGVEAPGAAAVRDLLSVGLNDMNRAVATQPPRLEEEMSIDIRPFRATQAKGD